MVLLLAALAPALEAQTLSIGVQSTLPAFSLVSNPTATNNLVVLTSWNFPVLSGQWFSASFSMCVYMTSPMAGTGNNTDTIPATAVQVNGSSIVTGGTNCGTPSAFLVSSWSTSWLKACPSGPNCSRSDTAGIRISGYPSSLEPDTYTGTINLIATVQ